MPDVRGLRRGIKRGVVRLCPICDGFEAADQRIAVYISIVLVSFATYWVLRIAARSSRWMSPIAMKLATRIMGLLLAAVAFQFLIKALGELNIIKV